MHKKWIAALQNGTVFFASCCISILAAELFARSFSGFVPNSGSLVYVEREDILDDLVLGSPLTTTRQRKNTGDYDVQVVFNRHGLRDKRDVSLASSRDYLAIGDSFTFGHGVEESQRFSNVLLEEYKLPIYNVAIPTDLDGYKALIEYSREIGAKTSKLIIGVCMENDLVRQDSAPSNTSSSKIQEIKQWLHVNSALYFMFTRYVHSENILRPFLVNAGLMLPNLKHNMISSVDINSTVEKLIELSNENDVFLVIIPSRYNWVGSDDSVSFNRSLHESFVESLRARDLKVVDIRQVFEAISDDPLYRFHFKNDGHWNEEGHAVAAEAIARQLRNF